MDQNLAAVLGGTTRGRVGGGEFRFREGKITATPGVLALAVDTGVNLGELLLRHLRGEWGDLSQGDLAANEHALVTGERLLSSYRVTATDRVWIITEATVLGRRAATTLLLPSEY